MFKTISLETLESMHVTKGELFKGVKCTFDYALPQDWLDDFSTFCKSTGDIVTYDLIRSTTVWAYPKNGKYSLYGLPLIACTEVYNQYINYLSHDVISTQEYIHALKNDVQ